MDIAIVDIKSQKRGQSLTNIQIQNAIVAGGMKILFETHDQESLTSMKKKDKFEIVKSHCE